MPYNRRDPVKKHLLSLHLQRLCILLRKEKVAEDGAAELHPFHFRCNRNAVRGAEKSEQTDSNRVMPTTAGLTGGLHPLHGLVAGLA